MEMWEYDSEMGGYVTLCERCGTAKGVSRHSGLCSPCDKVWNGSPDGREDDDHWDRVQERRQMGYGNL